MNEKPKLSIKWLVAVLFIIFLTTFIAYITAASHESVHSTIYAKYGIDSTTTIGNFGFGGSNVTVDNDQIPEQYTDEIRIMNLQTEIFGYQLFPIYLELLLILIVMILLYVKL
jgi:hypothetical protein